LAGNQDFDHDFNILLNFALGGNGGSNNSDPSPDPVNGYFRRNGTSYMWEQDMAVDYVRVYRLDSGMVSDTANPNTVLFANEQLRLPDGQNQAIMQPDGNFVVYLGGSAAWASGTNGTGADRVMMQVDGNLVVYQGTGAKWATGTYGQNGNYLK